MSVFDRPVRNDKAPGRRRVSRLGNGHGQAGRARPRNRSAGAYGPSQWSPTLPVLLPASTSAPSSFADLAATRPGAWSGLPGQLTALSLVAHDLRGPLTALATSSQLLVEDFDVLERGEIQGMVSAIHRRTIWLQGLVENVLAAATIGGGRFAIQRRPVSVAEVLDDVFTVLEPLLAQKRQRIQIRQRGERYLVLGDERRLGQVLANLLQNASKFSDDETAVDVTLAAMDNVVRVTVADRGPGIPRGMASRLFEPFERAPGAKASGKEGLGLGLAIVKTIIQAHGGRLGVRNRRGGGAVFWFELPSLQVTPELSQLVNQSKEVRR